MLWTNGPACVALAALLFSVATLLVKLSSDDLSAFTICAGQRAWQTGLPAGQDRAGVAIQPLTCKHWALSFTPLLPEHGSWSATAALHR